MWPTVLLVALNCASLALVAAVLRQRPSSERAQHDDDTGQGETGAAPPTAAASAGEGTRGLLPRRRLRMVAPATMIIASAALIWAWAAPEWTERLVPQPILRWQRAASTFRSRARALRLATAQFCQPAASLARFQASSVPAAQELFEAGAALAFSFNHAQATRLFERALALDHACVWCAWGVAYSAGPFTNLVSEDTAVPPQSYPTFTCKDSSFALTKAQQAHASYDAHGTPADTVLQQLISALLTRYAPAPAPHRCTTASLARNDEAYAAEMLHIVAQSKGHASVADADVLALSAVAVMIMRPWNYTTGAGSGLSVEGTSALYLLEQAIAADPCHLLAHHLRIHLLETQPLSSVSEAGAAIVQPGSLLQLAVDSADLLWRMASAPSGLNGGSHLTGHLLHMPAHAYIRVGDWRKAIKVSKESIEQDVRDARMNALPFYPAHNAGVGVVAAVHADDYDAAVLFAHYARDAHRLFPAATVSPGSDVLTLLEVHLQWGRCDQARKLTRTSGVRGRSSSQTGAFLDSAFTFRDVLCTVYDSKAASSDDVRRSMLLSARLQLPLLAHIAEQTPEDAVTKPGDGLGIYSAGSKVLVQIYNHTASAAVLDAFGEHAAAADSLRSAVELEHSMGYTEPPRVLLRLRPCLAAVLGRAGDLQDALDVASADLLEFPGNMWGVRALQLARESLKLTDRTASSPTWGANMGICSLLDGGA